MRKDRIVCFVKSKDDAYSMSKSDFSLWLNGKNMSMVTNMPPDTALLHILWYP